MSRPKATHPRRNTTVRLTDAEYAQIHDLAAAHSLSTAAYLRAMALRQRPRTTVDLEGVRRLVEANLGLNRVGGLLRIALKERKAGEEDLGAILAGIQEAQRELRSAALCVVESLKKGGQKL